MTTATTAAPPPRSEEFYNRLRRVLLQEANLLPQALPPDAQEVVTLIAFKGSEGAVAGFGRILELAADSAYERGWMGHEMFARNLLAAATAEPTPAERLTVVDGGKAS